MKSHLFIAILLLFLLMKEGNSYAQNNNSDSLKKSIPLKRDTSYQKGEKKIYLYYYPNGQLKSKSSSKRISNFQSKGHIRVWTENGHKQLHLMRRTTTDLTTITWYFRKDGKLCLKREIREHKKFHLK